MRRNAAGQYIQAMLQTSLATPITVVVPAIDRTVTAATNATPIVVTTATHGYFAGQRVRITGCVGNTAANGVWTLSAVTATTMTLAGSVGNGTWTSGGTTTNLITEVWVTKDGGTPTLGTGTATHIGRLSDGTAYVNTLATVAGIAVTGVTASGGTTLRGGGTVGLWSYSPSASETNASSVTFTWLSPALNCIRVTQSFEPTSGPILFQTTIDTLASQVSFTLKAGTSVFPTPPVDDDAFKGCLVVIYGATTSGAIAHGVISAYTQTTRTITLKDDPNGYTIAAGDYITVIADQSLKSAVMNRNLDADADGRVDVIKIAGTTQTARDIGASVVITSNIKKNQALAKFMFLMTDSTTHAPVTGKTVTVTRSIDGAAFAAGALSAVTELSDGLYGVDFAAADLNGNVVMLKATAAACDVTFERIITQQ